MVNESDKIKPLGSMSMLSKEDAVLSMMRGVEFPYEEFLTDEELNRIIDLQISIGEEGDRRVDLHQDPANRKFRSFYLEAPYDSEDVEQKFWQERNY